MRTGRRTSEVLGARYVRFHGLFHDDMFVYRTDNGGGFGPATPLDEPVYTFAYVDKVFDAILDAGARPFAELGFMPDQVATQTETLFWWKAHCSTPKDMQRWVELVTMTVQHWIDRYGINEVRLALRGLERAEARPALLDRHPHPVLRALRGDCHGLQGVRPAAEDRSPVTDERVMTPCDGTRAPRPAHHRGLEPGRRVRRRDPRLGARERRGGVVPDGCAAQPLASGRRRPQGGR